MFDHHYFTTTAAPKMPDILYGTAWKKDQTEDLVVKAVLAGFKGIDTACQPKHYNEPQIGSALHKLRKHGIERKHLFLQTKFTPLNGQDPLNIPYDKNAPLETQVLQSFETSKKNLRTDYVDSFVLHSPITPYDDLLKVWKTMELIHQTGRARQLGISNIYDLELLKRFYDDATVKPAVVQNRFYQDSGYDLQLRKWCLEHDVTYQSFWTLTANPHILDQKSLQMMARKYNKSAEQIFFRYLNLSGVTVLTGTTSGLHMKEDLDLSGIDLSLDEVESISRLLA